MSNKCCCCCFKKAVCFTYVYIAATLTQLLMTLAVSFSISKPKQKMLSKAMDAFNKLISVSLDVTNFTVKCTSWELLFWNFNGIFFGSGNLDSQEKEWNWVRTVILSTSLKHDVWLCESQWMRLEGTSALCVITATSNSTKNIFISSDSILMLSIKGNFYIANHSLEQSFFASCNKFAKPTVVRWKKTKGKMWSNTLHIKFHFIDDKKQDL